MKFTVNRTELLAAAQNALRQKCPRLKFCNARICRPNRTRSPSRPGIWKLHWSSSFPRRLKAKETLSSKPRFFPECCACWMASA